MARIQKCATRFMKFFQTGLNSQISEATRNSQIGDDRRHASDPAMDLGFWSTSLFLSCDRGAVVKVGRHPVRDTILA
jgi:hypothetical protein